MNPTRLAILSAVAVLAIGTGISVANAQSPTEIVEERQDHMKVFGNAMRVTGLYLREDAATIEEVQEAVMPAAAIAPDMLSWFPEGTEVGVGDSRALPIIWEQWDDFSDIANASAQAMVSFEEAVALGDPANIGAALGQVGQTCGTCHDTYRAEEQ
ncbi:MAG: cytochrome c [Pseudomonadota bacterium]